jgi:hypothetical protein
MVVGQTQAIQLLDQNGAPFTNPTWSISNPSIASIIPPVNQGDPTLIQATAIGNLTVTGTSPDGRTGTAQVAILSGTSLPVGTVQWEIPSLSSGTQGIANIVQSLRIDDTTPDFYVLDWGANGGSGAFRALTADGQQKWMFTPSAPSGEELALLAADDQGGFIYQRDDWSDLPMIGRVDENGNQTWLLSAPGIASNVAIHPDGTIYLVQQDYLNTGHSPTAVVALDGTTGQVKFAIPIPTGTSTGADFTYMNEPNGGSGGDGYPLTGGMYCTPGTAVAPQNGASKFGTLTISSDGTVYLPIGTSSGSIDAMPCDASPDPSHPGFPHLVKSTDGVSTASSYLQVMAIHSDGTYSLRQLDSTSASVSGIGNGNPGVLFAVTGIGGATPDGNGGTLVAVNNLDVSSTNPPSAFYHDTGSAVTKLNLAFNPTGEILTGEDSTAYLAGPNPSPSTTGAIAAIDTASNTINWTLSLPSGSPQLIAVPSAGGVVFQDQASHLSSTDPNGVISPLFPGSGGTDAAPLNTTNANYWTLGTWFASLGDGGLASLAGNNTFIAAAERPMTGGSQKKDSRSNLPVIVDYLPSQIEATPSANPNTLGFPCFQDATSSTSLKNALRKYTQNPCTTNPPATAPNQVAQQYRLQSSAIAQNFHADLTRDLAALAYFGHSSLANFGQPSEFSKGITFYYPVNPNKLPRDESSWDIGYNVPGSNPPSVDILAPECAAPNNFCFNPPTMNYLNKLLPFEKDVNTVTALSSIWTYRNYAPTFAIQPGPPHAPILLVNKVAQQAKILFFGSCALTPQSALSNEIPVFLQMWDINDIRFGTPETRDRAMIVPDGSSIANFDTNSTDLAYAAAMWNKILFDLVSQKKNVFDAVQDANNTITPIWPTVPGGSAQPKFMVLGNPRVKLK